MFLQELVTKILRRVGTSKSPKVPERLCFHLLKVQGVPLVSGPSEFFVEGYPHQLTINASQGRKRYVEMWFAGKLRVPSRSGWGYYEAQLCVRRTRWNTMKYGRGEHAGSQALLFCGSLHRGDELGYPVTASIRSSSTGMARSLKVVVMDSVLRPPRKPPKTYEAMIAAAPQKKPLQLDPQ